MGNSAAKLNRKFDDWLSKAYNYMFKEEDLPESSIDIASVNDEIRSENDENENEEDQKMEQQDPLEDHQSSNQIESIIFASITKEEYKADKRKASSLLLQDFNSKRVCVNKENIARVDRF